jgi:hypothetical protein
MQDTGMVQKDAPAMTTKPLQVGSPAAAAGGSPDTTNTGGTNPSAATTPTPSQAPNQTSMDALLNYLNTTPGTAPGADVLAAAQYYDPNASIYNGGYNDNGDAQYGLQFDYSKLPGALPGSSLGPTNTHGITGESQNPGFGAVTQNTTMYNPALTVDSSAYGKVTPYANINNDTTDGLFGTLGKVMPGVVMAALAAAGGMAGGAALSGFGSIGSTLGSSLGRMVPGELASMGSGNGGSFNPMALLPALGGALGLPSWAGSAIGAGLNISQGGSPLAAILSLIGGQAGIPGGSTLGNILGNAIDPSRPRNPRGG